MPPAQTSSEAIRIRPLVEVDAPALAACFTRCYGPSYVVAEFYDPAATAARIRNGSLRSVVAETESGEIVGHMGLTIRDPRAQTADAGNSIVDPRHRGRQLVAKLAMNVVELTRSEGFLGFHHYPTTVHPIMQKLAVAGGGVETGIMLDYIPAGTEYREIEDAPREGRPAVAVVYQAVRTAPAREVFVPPSLLEPARAMYALAGGTLPRTVRAGAGHVPSVPSHLETAFYDRRRLLRTHVETIGADLVERVAAASNRSDAAVWQVDLPLGDPATPAAAEALRALGYFFCSVLPEYLDGDVLRLQKLAGERITAPDLATDGGRALLALIEADHARTGATLRG